MTFNPITALSEQLQKLITEHGSAAILRDHLALFKDQLIVREKEFVALAAENAKLKDKIKALESQFDNATKEIERQNQIIKTLQGVQSTKKYDPITNKVIKLFFDAGRELSVNEVASILSIDINTIRYHFDLILQDKLIIQTQSEFESSWINESSPAMYDLTPHGRKYIVENKIP